MQSSSMFDVKAESPPGMDCTQPSQLAAQIPTRWWVLDLIFIKNSYLEFKVFDYLLMWLHLTTILIVVFVASMRSESARTNFVSMLSD